MFKIKQIFTTDHFPEVVKRVFRIEEKNLEKRSSGGKSDLDDDFKL